MRTILKPASFTLLLSLILALVVVAYADVIELKNGQKIEGAFKGADASAVKIEVGGQTITFRPDQVRSIHYGEAPSAVAATSPAAEALRALKALQSVTTAGVTYRDYSTRVGETKIHVDRLTRSPASPIDATRPIDEAMRYYITAGSVWSTKLSGSLFLVSKKDVPEDCPHYPAYLASLKQLYPSRKIDDLGGGFLNLSKGMIQVYWSCAGDKITEAERLIVTK